MIAKAIRARDGSTVSPEPTVQKLVVSIIKTQLSSAADASTNGYTLGVCYRAAVGR